MSDVKTPVPPELAQLRREYSQRTLDEHDVRADPIEQFTVWLNEALAAKTNEPNAMTLATATREGVPSARVVLLKRIDDSGFTFFTNYASRKGRELAENPRATLVFWWAELERQVRVEGMISKTSEAEADQYFLSRPVDSRIGALASAQSEVVESREVLERRFAQIRAHYSEDNIPRPTNWGGYTLTPHRVEFWQGRRSRLHDRVEYLLDRDRWKIQRLSP